MRLHEINAILAVIASIEELRNAMPKPKSEWDAAAKTYHDAIQNLRSLAEDTAPRPS